MTREHARPAPFPLGRPILACLQGCPTSSDLLTLSPSPCHPEERAQRSEGPYDRVHPRSSRRGAWPIQAILWLEWTVPALPTLNAFGKGTDSQAAEKLLNAGCAVEERRFSAAYGAQNQQRASAHSLRAQRYSCAKRGDQESLPRLGTINLL